MLLLRAALAGGAVVLSLGLILNIVNRLRAGDIYGAALGKFGAAEAQLQMELQERAAQVERVEFSL